MRVRPPFISSTEMMWQSVDGCGISDVLVTAQHRFQAQHFCLPCQPLRLKVCLCPSISSAFSLGLKKKGQALTLQVSAMSGNKLKTNGGSVKRKKPLNLCVLVQTWTGHGSRFVLSALSTGSVSLPAPHAARCWVPLTPRYFSRPNFQQLVWRSVAWKPPPWSSSVPYDKGLQSRYLERKRTLL